MAVQTTATRTGVVLFCLLALAAPIRASVLDTLKCWFLRTGCEDDQNIADIGKNSESDIVVDHTRWDEVLERIVVPGIERDGIQFNGVDYDLLRTDTALRQKHLDYMEMLSTTDISALAGNEVLAFMINAYNAFTVDLIVKEDVKEGGSIRDLTDPFKGSVFARFKWDLTFDGDMDQFSLNDIEHRIIREALTENDEPRIHAAVNCASLSCPDLRAEAYTGEKLDDQLEEQMNIWLQDPGKGIRLDKEENEIHMSTIFKWFKEDFVSTEHGGKNDLIDAKEPLDYAAQFATKDIQDYLKDEEPTVKFMSYNWELNTP